MSELERIKKEVEIEIFQKKVINLYKKHQKKIISLLFLTILSIIIFISYFIHTENQNKKYSTILQRISLNSSIDNSKSLKYIIDNSTSDGLSSIALFKQASVFNQAGDFDKSIEIYLSIYDNKNNDQFLREYAGLLSMQHIANSTKKHNFIDKIDKIISESKFLKYYFIEQKAIFLLDKNHDKAMKLFQLLSKNLSAPEIIKKRAKSVILLAEIL
jgi:hypothetical protein